MTWDPSEMQRRLQEWGEKVHEAAADALGEVVEQWGEDGNELIPVDQGGLKDSMATEVDRENLKAAVGWGSGESRRYAIVQHENTAYKHTTGQAKFGEMAGRKIAQTAAEDISAKIKASLG